MPLGQVKDTPSGALKNIIVERVDSIETALAHVLPEFTANLLAPLAVFIYLLVVDWRMALASLITLALGKAQQSYEKFEKAAREGADCFVEWQRRCSGFFSLAMTLMPCTAIAVVPIGGWLYMQGTLSFAHLVMCLILSLGLISPLITAMSYTDDLAKVSTIISEVTGILSWDEMSRPEHAPKPVEEYSISLEHVTFAYHDEEILHDVTMEIKEGTVNAFVGPSRGGKSTIAKLIASLWDVGDGSIRIGGADIRDLPLAEYSRNVAYVSQDNYLFNETIRENIRMGNINATDEEMEEAVARCGCHDFVMGLEHGYDTLVGSAGGHLSGGERQKRPVVTISSWLFRMDTKQ